MLKGPLGPYPATPDIPSSITNSPLDTTQRVNKLKAKLINDIEQMEYQSQRVKSHIQRSMDTNALLAQELDLVRATLKKSQVYKSAVTIPRNGKSILGSRGSILSPLSANRKMVKRIDAFSKKLQQLQARHAKDLEAEQQAQAARDLLESQHNSIGGY